MAFKMKGPSMHMGTSSYKKAHADATMKKKASAYKKHSDSAYKSNHTDWSKADMSSGGSGKSLNELVKMRSGVAKGSNEYNKIQNAINKQMGKGPQREIKADTTEKKGRKTVEKTTDLKGATDTTTKRKDGTVKKQVDQTNLSTYDAKKGTGSSGMGMKETTRKFDKKGKQKNKVKTTYSMGTDTKKDDKRVTTKIGKRKQVTKTRESDGSRSKTKDFTKGKRAGTSVTRERKKGQLFGRKVDVDYS